MHLEGDLRPAARAGVVAALVGFTLGYLSKRPTPQPTPSLTPQQISTMDLPPNVVSDVYGEGIRTVTFRTNPPVLGRQVIQYCGGNFLVSITNQTTKREPTDAKSPVFDNINNVSVTKNSPICVDDGRVTPEDNAPIPHPNLNTDKPTKNLQETIV